MAREIVRTLDASRRNLFINGDVQIVQRTGGFTTPISGSATYYFDRFKTVYAQATGGNISQSSTAIDDSGFLAIGGRDAPVPTIRVFGTASNSNAYLEHQQRVESIRHKDMNQQKISFGVKIWASNFQEVRFTVYQPDTTADNYGAQTAILSTTITITPGQWNFVKYEDLGLTNENGFEVRVRLQNPASPTGAFDSYMTEFMCNEGAALEPFRLMGKDFQEELALCQRYYSKSYDLDTSVGTVTISGSHSFNGVGTSNRPATQIDFLTRIRTSPAVTIYSTDGTINLIRDTDGSVNWGSDVQDKNERGFSLRASSGGVIGVSAILRAHWTADAEL